MVEVSRGQVDDQCDHRGLAEPASTAINHEYVQLVDMKVLQLLAGFVMIAALLAIQALALYVLARIVLIAVSRMPMIGRKHRHDGWDRLNRR